MRASWFHRKAVHLALLLAAIAFAFSCIWQLVLAISAQRTAHDVRHATDAVNAAPMARYAHAVQLEQKGLSDQALRVLADLIDGSDPWIVQAARWRSGNLYLQEVIDAVGGSADEQELAGRVELAKGLYRDALRQLARTPQSLNTSQAWQLRYNFEYAQILMPDPEERQNRNPPDEEAAHKDAGDTDWAQSIGIPRGMH